jgi:hypothetical protein
MLAVRHTSSLSNQENITMDKQIPTRTKALITGVVACFIFVFLLWDHFHGGVPSHHILHQKELPAISNWWSGLLLPILTWILLGRIGKRLVKQAVSTRLPGRQYLRTCMIFFIGLALGGLISISFVNDYKPVLDNVLYAFLIISLIIPIFYSEFILGFVLGMTITFGAILPTAFVLIMALPGFIVYRFIRPLFMKLINAVQKPVRYR